MNNQENYIQKTAIAKLLKMGFNDTSYHNDTMPSAEHNEARLKIWLDFDNVDNREIPDGKQFIVCIMDNEGQTTDTNLETNSTVELIDYLDNEIQNILLKKQATHFEYLTAIYEEWLTINNISFKYSADDLMAENRQAMLSNTINLDRYKELQKQNEWLAAFCLIWGE